jgi:uncharacterized protein (TIGR02246 family)
MILLFVSPAAAGPGEEAFSVVEQFKKTFDAADPPSVVKLFAANAVFIGTLMQGSTHDPEVILKYFQAGMATNPPRKITIENYDVLQISETAVLFSGQDVFSQEKEGQVVETPARFTFLITKGPDGWRVAHFHSSVRPPKPNGTRQVATSAFCSLDRAITSASALCPVQAMPRARRQRPLGRQGGFGCGAMS